MNTHAHIACLCGTSRHSKCLIRSLRPWKKPARYKLVILLAVSRRLVAQDETSTRLPVLVRLPDKERSMFNQFNTTSQQRAKNETGCIETSQPQKLRKRWYLPSFRLLTYTKKQWLTPKVKKSPHSEEGTKCSKLYRALLRDIS